MQLEDSLELISHTLWGIQNEDELKKVLEDLLTPAEICEIGDRITILKYLKQGYTQREIAEKMNISITTVSRGSKLFNFQNKAIKNYL